MSSAAVASTAGNWKYITIIVEPLVAVVWSRRRPFVAEHREASTDLSNEDLRRD
jgi:hypothetical protein